MKTSLWDTLQLKKALTAFILLPLFLLTIYYLPPLFFLILISIASLIAQWEYYSMVEKAGIECNKKTGMIFNGLFFICLLLKVPSEIILAIVLLLLFGMELLFTPYSDNSFQRVSLTTLGIAYITYLSSFLVLLRLSPDGRNLVLFLFISTWMGDAGAGYFGMFLGKHALPARINRKKTIEGIIGGTLTCVVFVLLLRGWVESGLSILTALILGIVLGLGGQIGDLVESMFKRSIGTGDSSNLIPGHGGMLDRIDSLLFTAPILYFFISQVMGQ